MASKQHRLYELSEAAVTDINGIYDYTFSEFGKKQAALYLTGLEEKILHLAGQPELGKSRSEIMQDLMSYNFKKHVIFYREEKNKLRIVRVLHVRQDIPKQFRND